MFLNNSVSTSLGCPDCEPALRAEENKLQRDEFLTSTAIAILSGGEQPDWKNGDECLLPSDEVFRVVGLLEKVWRCAQPIGSDMDPLDEV